MKLTSFFIRITFSEMSLYCKNKIYTRRKRERERERERERGAQFLSYIKCRLDFGPYLFKLFGFLFAVSIIFHNPTFPAY